MQDAKKGEPGKREVGRSAANIRLRLCLGRGD